MAGIGISLGILFSLAIMERDSSISLWHGIWYAIWVSLLLTLIGETLLYISWELLQILKWLNEWSERIRRQDACEKEQNRKI